MQESDKHKLGGEPLPGLASERLAPEGPSELTRKFHTFPKIGSQ